MEHPAERILLLEKVLAALEELRPHFRNDEKKLDEMAEFLQSRLMVLRAFDSEKK